MLPAEHKGFIEKRLWHKVRWVDNPHPGDAKWDNIAGKTDLMMDEDLKNYKDSVEILDSVKTEKCETGLAIRFGVTNESGIDNWIKRHKHDL